jgi:hypothetical protein
MVQFILYTLRITTFNQSKIKIDKIKLHHILNILLRIWYTRQQRCLNSSLLWNLTIPNSLMVSARIAETKLAHCYIM